MEDLKQELIALNKQFIVEEENASSEDTDAYRKTFAFFYCYLHEKLIFHRRNGVVDNKVRFLAGLVDSGNRNRKPVGDVEVKLSDDQQRAVVTLVVESNGPTGPSERVQSRNIRSFLKTDDGVWQCVAWYNEPFPPAGGTLAA